MLRTSIVAALVVLSTSAFAQQTEMKGIKFGVGCLSPVTTFAPRFGTCMVDTALSRIWCPNGQIFDRVEKEPRYSYVARAVCGLNQIL
jgi:hypothetical protein